MATVKFVRALDGLGRNVLPHQARAQLEWGEGDKIDVYLDREARSITLIKTVDSCLCCHSTENLKKLPDRRFLCLGCIRTIE